MLCNTVKKWSVYVWTAGYVKQQRYNQLALIYSYTDVTITNGWILIMKSLIVLFPELSSNII